MATNNEELLEEEEVTILTLTDDNGEEEQFEYLASIEYKSDEYLILLPEEDDTQNVIMKVIPIDEENEDYIPVEDEKVLNTVFQMFKEQYKDVFDFDE